MALVLSLVLVTVVAILSAGVVTLSSTTSKMEARSVDQLRAFYLAEAGLAESFAAVRMGRSGTIGAEDSPAAYGEGLVWVSAVQTSDNRIWLQSTGFAGTGKATLGLVVNPADPPLGFFSSEDLVIEEGVLVDGFDSSERPYEEEILLLNGLDPSNDSLASVFDAGGVLSLSTLSLFEPVDPLAPEDWYADGLSDLFMGEVTDEGLLKDAVGDAAVGTSGTLPRSLLDGDNLDASGAEPPAEEPILSVTNTDRGGMLGSNGSIDVRGSDPALIFGSAVPGQQGKVAGDSNLVVTESTESRGMAVELEPVEVPVLPSRESITHRDLAPVVISASDGDYDTITVADDCELILRGPARVSIETLVLSPRAILTLDTRDGDVDLFITGAMTCHEDSTVETTGRRSSEVRIQGATNDFTGAAAELDFQAISSFYGTIYAPDSTVKIGSLFEVFGSVVAKRLEVEPGARLHYDNRAYNGNAALPTQEAWRILDLPDSARQRRAGGSSNGLSPLAESHRLSDVKLSVRYLDALSVEHEYTGLESGFDWSRVTAVVSMERDVDYRVANSAEERSLRERWSRRLTGSSAGLAEAESIGVDAPFGGVLDVADAGVEEATEPVTGAEDPVAPVVSPELIAAREAVPIDAARRAVELAVAFGVRDLDITIRDGYTAKVASGTRGGSFEIGAPSGEVMYIGTIDSGGGVSIRVP